MNKAFFIVLAGLLFPFFSAAQTNFFFGTIDEAKELASIGNKTILIDCYASWCDPCKKMIDQTFQDSLLSNQLNNDFIVMRVDMDKHILGDVLAKKYQITSYPTFLFIDSAGKLIQRNIGFCNPADFILLLKEARLKKSNAQFLSYSADLQNDYPAFYNSYYTNKIRPDQQLIDSYLNEQTNLFSENAWSMFSSFRVAEKYANFLLAHHETYREKYGEEEVEKVINDFLISMVDKAAEGNDEKKLDKILSHCHTYFKSENSFCQKKAGMMMQFYFKTGNISRLLTRVEAATELHRTKAIIAYNVVRQARVTADQLNLIEKWLKQASVEEKDQFINETLVLVSQKQKKIEKTTSIAQDSRCDILEEDKILPIKWEKFKSSDNQ